MLRQLFRLGNIAVRQEKLVNHKYGFYRNQSLVSRQFSSEMIAKRPVAIRDFLQKEQITSPTLIQYNQINLFRQNEPNRNLLTITRHFHAAGSKVKYLDFRYRLRTNHLRLHLLIIRRQKMKKHKRRKFRRKFKCLLAKQKLKREIAKEKAFRVELLTKIRKAENFDPREYALNKIAELNNKPRVLTKAEKLEELKELVRKNRYQVDYIKPKHRRAEI